MLGFIFGFARTIWSNQDLPVFESGNPNAEESRDEAVEPEDYYIRWNDDKDLVPEAKFLHLKRRCRLWLVKLLSRDQQEASQLREWTLSGGLVVKIGKRPLL